VLDSLRQNAVWRHTREHETAFFKTILVINVHLVAVTMTLGDFRAPVDLSDLGAILQRSLVGAQTHRAAEIAGCTALFKHIALQPFGHEADYRLLGRAELGRRRVLDPGERASSFNAGHLHAETDAEIRHLAFACKACGSNLALRSALTEAAR